MILAAGLTPAWQQIAVFDTLRLGEVNRAREVHWCASGKVLNVGIALTHLGASVKSLALAGGRPAEDLERDMARLGVPRRWISTQRDTRVCTTILDRQSGMATELVEEAGPISADELAAFRRAFAEEVERAKVVVLTGSLPPGTPRDFCRELIGQTSAPAILDIRGEELLQALNCKPLMVKPNRDELAQTLGRQIESEAQIRAALSELNQRGAQWAVITQGTAAIWASGPSGVFRLQPLSVATVNPIGSGDCFAAAVAWGLSAGKPPLDCLRLGVAAAADNASQLLVARLDPQRVLAWAEKVTVDEA